MPVQTSLFDGTSSGTPSTAMLTAARLSALVQELILLNEELPIVTDGAREEAALRRLGLKGAILRCPGEKALAAFGKRIGRAHPAVIVLTGWDRRGRRLQRELVRHLDEACEDHLYFRHELKALCAPAISTIEELPAHLAAHAGHPAAT